VLAVAVLVLAPVIRTLLHRLVPAFEPLIDQSFPTVADSIAGGCLLALGREFLDRSAAYLRFVRSPAFWLAPGVALLAAAMEPHPALYNLAGKSVEIAAITVTIDGCMRNAAGPTRWLDWAPLSFVGTLSYSLYLWQQPFLDRTEVRVFTTFPLNIALVFVFALASYFGVEKPFLRLRQRLEQRRPSRGSARPLGKKVTAEPAPLPPIA
jgi:peptidoglycan/LPS O-acetylase OafA/YrhL